MPLTYIQFKTFDDFIRFITVSSTPFVQYTNINGHSIYFIQLAAFGELMLYYIERDKKIEERYIVYNRFRDSISFSNKIESDGQSLSIPILEVARTNIFQEYPPK